MSGDKITFDGVKDELDFMGRCFYFNGEGTNQTKKVEEEGQANELHKSCKSAFDKLRGEAHPTSEKTSKKTSEKTKAEAAKAAKAAEAAEAAKQAAKQAATDAATKIFAALHTHYCKEIVKFIGCLAAEKPDLQSLTDDHKKKAVTQFYLSAATMAELPTIIINDTVMGLINTT